MLQTSAAEVDQRQIDIYRKRSFAERFYQGCSISDTARKMVTYRIRQENPQLSLMYDGTSNFKKVISETGLPNIRFHDLRHTVATLLLAKEINPKIVQEQLGHSSIHPTLNTYSHVIKSMRSIAANALEGVFGSA